MSKSYILGCDPGFTGAFAFLAPDGEVLGVLDMPLVETQGKRKLAFDEDGQPFYRTTVLREIDAKAVKAYMEECLRISEGNLVFVQESVWARPQDGRSSIAKLLLGAGIVQGVAAGLGLKTLLPAPATWKAAMKLGADKKLSLALVNKLFPAASHFWKRFKDHNRAEAALLAAWGYNQVNKAHLGPR